MDRKATVTRHLLRGLILIGVLLFGGLAAAQDEEFSDFADVEMEDILNTRVVSATKVEQSIMEAPNSIWVITAQDIRQAGARNIPEALKLAPGVYVAQISGNEWVVSLEGFAFSTFANKILVLVDGVSIYQTQDGQVNWSQIPVTIDEVERIEVIRGPGGVTYGANAVNGVINIITKAPGKGDGAYVTTRVGSQGDRSFTAAADLSSEDGAVSSRISAGHDEGGGLGADQGKDIFDGRQVNTVSARNRVNLGQGVTISLDGRYSQGELDYPYLEANQGDRTNRYGLGIVSWRLDQHLDNDGQWYFQAFHKRLNTDQAPRDGEYSFLGDSSVTDVEFQSLTPFEALGRQSIIVGGGYRWIDEKATSVKDGEQYYHVANVYMSHEWKMTDQWIWNAGLKWEEISLIDPTWQWRAALIFMPTPEHAFRISAANAYRSPSLTELYQNIVIPAPAALTPYFPPGVPQEFFGLRGNEGLDPEQIVSYEFGYRGMWGGRALVDVLYAYRQYDNLISIYQISAGQNIPVPFPPFALGPVAVEWGYDDQGEATSQDIELGVNYRITDQLRLLATYTHIEVEVSGDHAFDGYETSVPKNFGRVGLDYQSPQGTVVDVSGNYVDEVELMKANEPGADPQKIDDYWRIDARVAQQFKTQKGDFEIGVVGTNLGQEWNEEYMNASSQVGPLSLRRAYYGYVEYKVK